MNAFSPAAAGTVDGISSSRETGAFDGVVSGATAAGTSGGIASSVSARPPGGTASGGTPGVMPGVSSGNGRGASPGHAAVKPQQQPLRPPKAPPPRKAQSAADCERLEQLPNIGPSIAAELRLLGIAHPRELAAHDALQLYQQLCRVTNKRHDPCVLDTFMAATDFMRGAPPRPWWDYTPRRKAEYGAV